MSVDAGMDFDPMVEQGVLQRPAGMLGRMLRKVDLPAVEPGLERVVLDTTGYVVDLTDALPERPWNGEGRWVKVDLTAHEMRFDLTYREQDGSAGYLIAVRVMVTVVDPVQVVRRTIHSVAPYVLPGLRGRMDQALPPTYQQMYRDNHVAALDARRNQIAAAVCQKLPPGVRFSVEGWLSVHVIDVSVAFDEATDRHHRTLVDLRHKEQSAAAQLQVQNVLAERMDKRLRSPYQRAADRYALEPTRENLDKLAAELDAAEERLRQGETAAAERQQQFAMEIVQQLIDKNIIADVRDVSQAVSIVASAHAGTAGTPPALDPGTHPALQGTPQRVTPPAPQAGSADTSTSQDGSPAVSDPAEEW
jgi:hypothetical protein